jgi:hypothetical protein
MDNNDNDNVFVSPIEWIYAYRVHGTQVENLSTPEQPLVLVKVGLASKLKARLKDERLVFPGYANADSYATMEAGELPDDLLFTVQLSFASRHEDYLRELIGSEMGDVLESLRDSLRRTGGDDTIARANSVNRLWATWLMQGTTLVDHIKLGASEYVIVRQEVFDAARIFWIENRRAQDTAWNSFRDDLLQCLAGLDRYVSQEGCRVSITNGGDQETSVELVVSPHHLSGGNPCPCNMGCSKCARPGPFTCKVCKMDRCDKCSPGSRACAFCNKAYCSRCWNGQQLLFSRECKVWVCSAGDCRRNRESDERFQLAHDRSL